MEWPGNDLGGGRGNLFDEGLGKSMRWWATETADGRLILRRSAAIRCCALAAPLASVASRFTLSTLDLTEDSAHSGFIERTRIAIENGDGDDAIRLPGCVIGMTWGALGIAPLRLFFETASHSGSDTAFAVLFLLLGPVAMAYPLYRIYECFQRVVVDEQGIRAGRRSCVWPESRSGLFVAGDRIFVVGLNGRHLALDGAGVTWGSFQRRQEQLVARCEAIWLWGVAHGATRETGRYLPLANEGMQDERETLERRIGLVVPHRGQAA